MQLECVVHVLGSQDDMEVRPGADLLHGPHALPEGLIDEARCRCHLNFQ